MTTLSLIGKVLAIVVAILANVQNLDSRVSVLEQHQVSGSPAFGAVSFLSSPIQVDGTNTYYARLSYRTGAATNASYHVLATSTLEVATCSITGGNTSASTYELAWGATNTASTTNLARKTIGAAGTGVIVATTTLTSVAIGNGTDGVIPPGYINLNSFVAANAPTGGCTLKFMTI